MELVKRWFDQHPTRILWITGEAGAGKTAAVEAALSGRIADALILRVADLGLDRALVEAGAIEIESRVTTIRLLEAATTRHVLVLDGLGAVQQPRGANAREIADVRLRQLLAMVSAGVLACDVVVTSRLRPPDWLRETTVTLVELENVHARTAVAGEPRVDDAGPRAISASGEAESDAERLVDSLVDAGDIDEAVSVYWQSVGNFSRLHPQGRDHEGMRLCQRLNEGLGPDELSPRLAASEGAAAVMNDWSQFAICCGDARVSALAAASAYGAIRPDSAQWDAALIAGHVAKAELAGGNLLAAMEWCERAWNDARQGLRKSEGFAAREVMDAYDWSAVTIAEIYLRLGNPAEVQRLIDDLTAIHVRARESIDEFNASSLIHLARPEGDVTAGQLANGRLAASLALAERRYGDLEPLAEIEPGTVHGDHLQMLALRAAVAAGDHDQIRTMLPVLRAEAESQDDCAAECELAVLGMPALADATERLAVTDTYLPRAQACGLGLSWRDLQLARAHALLELERRQEARAAAEAALYGGDGIAGAHGQRDWASARQAIDLLQSIAAPVPEHVARDVEAGALPSRESPRQPEPRREIVSTNTGADARVDMHAAAERVLNRYQNEGMPFALYFRKFGIEVLHGPFELGAKLTENALRDALAPHAEVLTIQEQSRAMSSYDMGPSRLRREAPALLLDDQHWLDVVAALIPLADLIVSEALMMGFGVRRELQMIYDAGRWDRTVLVLPPLNSVLAVIDNHPLVQMFPRCIWADSFHQEPLSSSPVITDLLHRLREIAALPVERRRELVEPSARDLAYPIDLEPVARHLEDQAQMSSLFHQDDRSTRYYAFWQMFRAAAIRGNRFKLGDDSLSNRCLIARSYIQMSKIMLDHTFEDDKVILEGDPAEAKLLVQSAYGLLDEAGAAGGDLWARALRDEAEKYWDDLLRLEQAIADDPARFEVRPRYGPLVKARRESS